MGVVLLVATVASTIIDPARLNGGTDLVAQLYTGRTDVRVNPRVRPGDARLTKLWRISAPDEAYTHTGTTDSLISSVKQHLKISLLAEAVSKCRLFNSTRTRSCVAGEMPACSGIVFRFFRPDEAFVGMDMSLLAEFA